LLPVGKDYGLNNYRFLLISYLENTGRSGTKLLRSTPCLNAHSSTGFGDVGLNLILSCGRLCAFWILIVFRSDIIEIELPPTLKFLVNVGRNISSSSLFNYFLFVAIYDLLYFYSTAFFVDSFE
jgi:hypothetical protein